MDLQRENKLSEISTRAPAFPWLTPAMCHLVRGLLESWDRSTFSFQFQFGWVNKTLYYQMFIWVHSPFSFHFSFEYQNYYLFLVFGRVQQQMVMFSTLMGAFANKNSFSLYLCHLMVNQTLNIYRNQLTNIFTRCEEKKVFTFSRLALVFQHFSHQVFNLKIQFDRKVQIKWLF